MIQKPGIIQQILNTLIRPQAVFIEALKQCKRHFHVAGHSAVLSFDIDYERDVHALPDVCAVLKKQGIPAAFAVTGMLAEKYPDEHKMLAEQGFELMNHTYRHPNHDIFRPDRFFRDLSDDEIENEIICCHRIVKDITGIDMKGFRIPHFANQYDCRIYRILKKLDYTYSSSSLITHIDWSCFTPVIEGITEIPITTCPQHPYTAFDSWHCFCAKGGWHKSCKAFRDITGILMKLLKRHNALGNFYFDPAYSEFLEVFIDTANCAGIGFISYTEMLKRVKNEENDG